MDAAQQSGDAAGLQAAALQLLDAAETIGASALIEALRPLSDAAAAGDLSGSAELADRVREEVENTVAFWSHIEIEEQ